MSVCAWVFLGSAQSEQRGRDLLQGPLIQCSLQKLLQDAACSRARPALWAQISGRVPALRGINLPFPSSSSCIMSFEFVYLIRPLGLLKLLV